MAKVATSAQSSRPQQPSKPIHIVLTGHPLTVNHLYASTRTGRRYITKDGRLRKEAYAWETRVQYRGPLLEENVAVTILLYYPNNRRRDADNALKTVFDALTGIVLKDDSQIKKHSVEMLIDKINPRVELTITTLCHQ